MKMRLYIPIPIRLSILSSRGRGRGRVRGRDRGGTGGTGLGVGVGVAEGRLGANIYGLTTRYLSIFLCAIVKMTGTVVPLFIPHRRRCRLVVIDSYPATRRRLLFFNSSILNYIYL